MRSVTTARAAQKHPGWGLWLAWILTSISGYALGVAISGAMGEVVGEALGGAVLHQLGHTVGMDLFGAMIVLVQWPVLQQQVVWAGRWLHLWVGDNSVFPLLTGDNSGRTRRNYRQAAGTGPSLVDDLR